ncbi:MAG: energy transducer TonB [Alphaproteobacteria bacterium]
MTIGPSGRLVAPLAPTTTAAPRLALAMVLSAAVHGLVGGAIAWGWRSADPAPAVVLRVEMVLAPPAADPAAMATPPARVPEPPPDAVATVPAAPMSAPAPATPVDAPPALPAEHSVVRRAALPPRAKPAPPRPERNVPATPVAVAPTAAADAVPAPAPVAVGVPAATRAPPAVASLVSAPPSTPAMPPSAYLARLLAWIGRHKEYPRLAREAGIEGEVLVRFQIDRVGAVVQRSIERSSGHGVLDRAVLRMIERASPVPAPPDDLARLDFTVPIRFGLD